MGHDKNQNARSESGTGVFYAIFLLRRIAIVNERIAAPKRKKSAVSKSGRERSGESYIIWVKSRQSAQRTVRTDSS